jgi:hypothetical protein
LPPAGVLRRQHRLSPHHQPDLCKVLGAQARGGGGARRQQLVQCQQHRPCDQNCNFHPLIMFYAPLPFA